MSLSFHSAAPESPEQNLNSSDLVAVPPTVTVRRHLTDRRSSRRRSSRIQERGLICELDLVPASPIGGDPKLAERVCEEEQAVRHSTPEATPPRKTQQRAARKPANQQPRSKPEPPARKQERGRRPEVGPLKKPWENSKPRARSKSRDRSARAAPAAPSHKANTSLGFNDNFDFDCEESVHVTPFRGKAEENPVAQPGGQQGDGAAAIERNESLPSSPSSPSSQSEDSLYVPHKKWRRRSSAGQTKVIATRRGRTSGVARGKENISSKSPISTSCFTCWQRSLGGFTFNFLLLLYPR